MAQLENEVVYEVGTRIKDAIHQLTEEIAQLRKDVSIIADAIAIMTEAIENLARHHTGT